MANACEQLKPSERCFKLQQSFILLISYHEHKKSAGR